MSAIPETEGQIAPLLKGGQSSQFAALVIGRETTPVGRLLFTTWTRLKRWYEKRGSRRVLFDLTDAELSDIGLTRAEAQKEARKSFFWD
jgi:uncharacterized protein YjiS (DUF1127 family)